MKRQNSLTTPRAPSALALLIATCFTQGSFASIDLGRTIESVTTQTSTVIDGGGYATTTVSAIIDQHAGVIDHQTGLQWIRASTLAEGEAQGYRAATSDEFRTWLTHAGWVGQAGAPNEYLLTNGFSYYTSVTYSSASNSESTFNNVAAMRFDFDTSIAPTPTGYPSTGGFIAGSSGWLDGGEGGHMGSVFHQFVANTSLSACSGGRITYCRYYNNNQYEALVANVADLQSGLYDNATHVTGGNWSGLLPKQTQPDGSVSLMYFMVASVPEPSTYALMSLGLIAVVGAARRQRQRHRGT